MSLTPEELEIAKERFKHYDKMCDLYNTNEEFKTFVDKTCKSYNLHKDIALLHKTVQDVGYYYINKAADKEHDICPNVIQEDIAEDKAC